MRKSLQCRLEPSTIAELVSDQAAQKTRLCRSFSIVLRLNVRRRTIGPLFGTEAIEGSRFNEGQSGKGCTTTAGQFASRETGRGKGGFWLIGGKLCDRKVVAIIAYGAGIVARLSAFECLLILRRGFGRTVPGICKIAGSHHAFQCHVLRLCGLCSPTTPGEHR